MMIRNIIRFIGLVFFQVLILNHVSLGGYVNPYLYVLFILWLPFSTERWMLLLSAFLLGFSVDIFTNTLGLNAAASVAMAFARPFVISMISTGTEFESASRPSINGQGMRWFLSYAVTLVLIHHFVLFYLEVFRFSEFFPTLLRVLLSSAFTLGLILLAEYLTVKKK
jgi:hypothetical protein